MLDTTISRLVPLEGAHNVRDLGGYPSRFGGTVRWGRVFRGDGLDQLTAGDIRIIESIGVRAVYDLRTIEERETAPDAIRSHHVPVLSRVVTSFDDVDFTAIADHDDGVRFMTELLLGLLEHAGPEFGVIIHSLASPAGTPMLFHCTAGKDRTGLLAALVLELLGVPRDDVLDDFELTAHYHRATGSSMLQRMLDRGVAPEAAAGVLGAPRSMMSDVLDVLDDRYGGIEQYLVERARVDRPAIEIIRSLLLT